MQKPLSSLIILMLSLTAWSGCARGEDDLFLQRFSALRLLLMQSALWNPDEKKHGLSLNGSMEGHYTSNAALSQDGTSDWYVAATTSAAWGHRLGDGWRTSIGADACAFRYLRQPDLGTSYLDAWGSLARDFSIGALPSGAFLTVSQQWTQVSNFTNGGASTEVLLGGNVDWEFFRGQTLSLEPMASITPWSSPWGVGFSSCGAYLSYSLSVTSAVEVSVFYNGYLTSYFARQTDFTQYVGAGLTWNLCKEIAISASVVQTWNRSNNAGSNYSALDVGGTLGLSWSL